MMEQKITPDELNFVSNELKKKTKEFLLEFYDYTTRYGFNDVPSELRQWYHTLAKLYYDTLLGADRDDEGVYWKHQQFRKYHNLPGSLSIYDIINHFIEKEYIKAK